MIIPKALQRSDTAGILATAKKVAPEEITPAIEIFKSWGLEVVSGINLYEGNYYLAGTDQERIEDLQNMINDPEIKAVFCARGGYGTTRIIDKIDLGPLHKNPKWIIGYSDITALHGQLFNAGIASIHGIMPFQMHKKGAEAAVQSLKKLLFEKELTIRIKSEPGNKSGNAEAMLIGGNLSMLCSVAGTKSEVDFRDKILFIEEVDEYLYQVDRMMVQLKRSGKLDHLAGLVVGQFTDMQENDTPFGKNVNEVILEHVGEYDYPVCFNFPVGHDVIKNMAVPVGIKVNLKVEDEQVILESKW